VRGSEAEEEWQEVDWVTWSTGELSVDGDSFLLVFKPAATGSAVKAKPLGNLIRATTTGGDGDGQRTLVVSTSDAVHGQYRFTFSDVRFAVDFKNLADAVEAAHAAAVRKGAEASARSSSGHLSQRAAQLETAIQEKYAGSLPLIFGASDLYGPAPGDASGSEVLLGRGAVVLLDPEEECRTIGEYKLLFFSEDEGASKPTKSFPIGPRMSLKRQQPDADDADGPAAMFEFRAGPGLPVHSICFDEAATAATFARDFRVRSRLMDISLKTAKGQHAVNEVRDELRELRRQSVGARLWRLLCLIMVLLLVAVVARVGLLYSEQPGKAPEAYLEQVKKDLTNVGHASHTVVVAAGSKVCELAVGAVPAADLQKCLAVGGVSQVHECVEQLVSR